MAAVALAAVVAAGPATAEQWEDRAEIRLIDGGVLADGVTRLAGIEVVLDPGWKTYWRNPGDSGIPPRMDFSASENVADVTIEWPAPELHFDGYGWVIGYTEAVIFPLLVSPRAPGDPTSLSLKLDYAVCKDICVPAEAEVAIALNGEKPRTAEIDFYRERVPEPANGSAGVVSSAVVTKEGAPVLELHLRFPGGTDDAFAVVEGPEGWHLPVPQRAGTDPAGDAVFEVPLGGVPGKASISGAVIRVTGVSPDFSFEQSVTLD